jgi:hypothetical protein
VDRRFAKATEHASLDKRAWRPHAKRANSLAGEDIDESNCFWPAGPRPARRSSLRGGRSRLRRWSLSCRMRWTPWRGRWPSAIRLPRRRRGAPCLWRALLLAGRRARLPLNGARALRDTGCGVVRDRRARASYCRRAQRSHYGRAADASFVVALTGFGRARFIALAFAVSLAPLTASQIELAGEIRVYIANAHLE